jgi:P pilus assembly chaperone PapD
MPRLSLRRGPFALGLAACLLVAMPVHGQAASVSPQAILVTDQARVATLHVLNPHSTPLEIVVDLRYGYVATDSAGRTVVELPPDSMPATNSAVPILRVSPSRFVLAPGEVQLVRVAAFPRPDLPQGEYWARIGVQAIPPVASGTSEQRGISVGVGIQVKTVLPVFYRHRQVATGIQVDDVTPTRAADSLILRPTFTRSGTAAALLAVETTVLDASGGVVAKATRQAAVYRTLSPRYAVPLTADQWARATQVRLAVTSQRPDLPAGLPLPVLPVTRTSAIMSPPK